MPKSRIVWIIAILMGIALAVGLWRWLPALLGGADSSASTPPKVQVGVVTVQPQALAISTDLAGRTKAYLTADVRPQIGGIVQKRLFTEGADVRAGEVLYQIDPASYQAAYDSAKADLAKAEASVRTALPKAESYAALAKLDAVSRQDTNDAEATLAENRADAAAAQAALETARINLAYTQVKAPISGRIGTSSVTPGALVTAEQTDALATIQRLDLLYVDVTQPSMAVLKLRKEFAAGKLTRADSARAKISLKLEDGSLYEHEGTLEFRGVTVDQTMGTITLRGVVPNPEGALMPGMYVHAVLEEGVNDQAFLLTQQGVTRDQDGSAYALLVDKDGKVVKRALTLNGTRGHDWIVTAGLQAGDRVIVEGVQKVQVGDTVTAVATTSSEAPTTAPRSN